MTREELALEAKHLDLLEALAKAKAGKDSGKVREASEDLVAFREKWREVRSAFGAKAGSGDGIAVPVPLGAPAKTPKVG